MCVETFHEFSTLTPPDRRAVCGGCRDGWQHVPRRFTLPRCAPSECEPSVFPRARRRRARVKEQLYSTGNYKRRDLDCVQFRRCNFRGADFSDQTLSFFRECNLEGADFTGADRVTGPEDRRWGVGRELGTYLNERQSPAIGFDECNLSAEQFYSTRIYASKKFQPGCRMERMDLTGWDFSNFDLRYVHFALSRMHGAKLDNAYGGRFRGAQLSLKQVKSLWNYNNGQMTESSAFTLPVEIAKQLAAEASEAEK